MKNQFVSFLAIVASACVEGRSRNLDFAEELRIRWNMDEPNITYFSDNNTFQFDYPTASTANNASLGGMQEEFYDYNCKDDGSGFVEYVIPEGITGPDGVSPAAFTNGPDGKPQLIFRINTTVLANDPKIYTVIDASMVRRRRRRKLDETVIVNKTCTTEYSVLTPPPTESPTKSHPPSESRPPSQSPSQSPTNTARRLSADTNDVSGDPDEFDSMVRERDLFDFTSNGDYQFTVDDIDKGVMRFCVRSSIGYGGIANDTMTLQEQISAGFYEVNFIESLITIFYDMTAEFCVVEFNVQPKEREETTEQKDPYNLIAWFCNRTAPMEVFNYTDAPSRSMPPLIDGGYRNITDNPNSNPYAQYFNQGSLITVCVSPDDNAWIDGVRMDGINSFNWVRNDLNETAGGSTLDGTPGSVAGYGSDLQVFQQAIKAGGPATNQLTSYIDSNCREAVYCTFSTILFADFYISRGVVSGDGSANLVFVNTTRRERRLGEKSSEFERRELQDVDDAFPFDLRVTISDPDDGPGALRQFTEAGGASFGVTVAASFVALASAALLV